jgi:hypothetical protein
VNYAKDEDPSQCGKDVQDHCNGKSQASQSISEAHPDQQIVQTQTAFAEAGIGCGDGSIQGPKIFVSLRRKE